MFNNPGVIRVLLFLGCLIAVDAGRSAGFYSRYVQVILVALLMIGFLFWKQILQIVKRNK